MAELKTQKNDASVEEFLDGVSDERKRQDSYAILYKTGKSCLYINKLEDVDLSTLRELVEKSVTHMAETNS